MANEAELIEPKIKSSFKKVKSDITSIRSAIKRQNESITEIRKSFADTMGRDDFYSFTEKLSERIDNLQSHFVSNDEFAKATEKIAKRIADIKKGQKQLQGIDLKSEFKKINEGMAKLQDNTVQRKDYERLVTNAEHNFNEIAREVEASKEYDRQLKQLNKQVSDLSDYKKASDERIRQLNTELTSLVKNFQSETKQSRQAMEKEMKDSSSRIAKLEAELSKVNDSLSQKAQPKDVETRISDEIRQLKENSEFVKLDELNQKIDEFNTIIDELQPKEENEKRIAQLMKERISPLEKDIATVSRQQDEMRRSMENTITRFERRIAGFEKSQEGIAEKFEKKSTEQLEKRMAEIEKIASRIGSESGTESQKRIDAISSQLSDLEEEHRAVMNEVADISSKPDMNSRMLEGLSKDFQSVRERLDSMEDEIEVASASAKGKGKQNEDVKYLREEIDFLRNSFVSREEMDDAVSSVMDEVKSSAKGTSGTSGAESSATEPSGALHKELEKLSAGLTGLSSQVSAMDANMQKRLSAYESDAERNSGQFAVLHDDIKGLLERQSMIEKRLGQVEAANSDLIRTNADMESKVKSASEQLKDREKAIRELEKEHQRALKEKDKEAQKEISRARKSSPSGSSAKGNPGGASDSEADREPSRQKRGFLSRMFLGSEEDDYYESGPGEIDFGDSPAKADSAEESKTAAAQKKTEKKSSQKMKDEAASEPQQEKQASPQRQKEKGASQSQSASQKKSAQQLIDELSKEKAGDEQKGKGRGLFGRVADFFTEDDSREEDETLY